MLVVPMGAHCFDCHPPPCTHARPPSGSCGCDASGASYLPHLCHVYEKMTVRVRMGKGFIHSIVYKDGVRSATFYLSHLRCFKRFRTTTSRRAHTHDARTHTPHAPRRAAPRCRGFIHTHTHTSTTRATCSDEAFVNPPDSTLITLRSSPRLGPCLNVTSAPRRVTTDFAWPERK